MPSRYPEIDPTALKTQPVRERTSKVKVDDFARAPEPGMSLADFLLTLPHILAGNDLREVAGARRKGRAVVWAMGAHVIKCGLSSVIIDLMRRGIITAIALNGNDSARIAASEGLGFGEALGKGLLEANAPHARVSILAQAYTCKMPATVHVAVGRDIVHMHPDADGAASRQASLRDFRLLTAAMRDLGGGGVLFNAGSAVVLPEILLKAMAILKNLGPEFLAAIHKFLCPAVEKLIQAAFNPTPETESGVLEMGVSTPAEKVSGNQKRREEADRTEAIPFSGHPLP